MAKHRDLPVRARIYEAIQFITYEFGQMGEEADDADDKKATMHGVLESTVQEAISDTIAGHDVFGNDKGRVFLTDLERMKLKEAEGDRRIELMEQRMLGYESEMKMLSEGYLKLRDRFLENFSKATIAGYTSATSIINACDISAAEGNCVSDATLYKPGGRSDTEIFTQLYGFTPTRVLELDKHQNTTAINMLNKHASLLVRKFPSLHNIIITAFTRFVNSQGRDLANVSEEWADPRGGNYNALIAAYHRCQFVEQNASGSGPSR